MKQFFLPLTEPVAAVWALMLMGTLWLLIRRQWRGACISGLPTVFLFVLGSTTLVETLVDTEERQWESYTVYKHGVASNRSRSTTHSAQNEALGFKPQASGQGLAAQVQSQHDVGLSTNGTSGSGSSTLALQSSNAPPPGVSSSRAPAAEVVVVVVLGGGCRISEFDPYGFAAADAFSRILTGIDLVRRGVAKDLVLGGSYPRPGKPQEPGMVTVDDWVRSWGLAACEVTNLGICLDTHDEAVAFKKLKRFKDWNSVILVTSALHMRRSMLLFERMGIPVQPVAADFEVCGVSQDLPFSIFPRQHRFHLWGLYLHEKIGMIVYRKNGWI